MNPKRATKMHPLKTCSHKLSIPKKISSFFPTKYSTNEKTNQLAKVAGLYHLKDPKQLSPSSLQTQT